MTEIVDEVAQDVIIEDTAILDTIDIGNVLVIEKSNVDDVQVDSNSVVDGNKIARLQTINGNYNASSNKIATQSDLPATTSDLTNDGDGTSAFATEDYVDTNGGKIDSISVNNVAQTIDENKNVDITVPTQASDVNALPDSTKYGASLSVSGTTIQLKDQSGNNLGSAITTQDTGATNIETIGVGNAITSASYNGELRKITFTKGTEFQPVNDNSLDTTAKNVVSAINEVNSVAKNANIAKGFTSYQALITELNSASATDYKVGQSFYVQTLEVPDLWIISIESTSSTYIYTTDSAFVIATGVTGGQQVGYYKLAQQETQKVDLTNYVPDSRTIAGVDLQDNITKSELLTALNVADGAEVNAIQSVSTPKLALTPDANKNVQIPYAKYLTPGLVEILIGGTYGIDYLYGAITSDTSNALAIKKATNQEIDAKSNDYKPIVPTNLNYAVKSALTANNHLTMTSAEQDTAQSVLGVNTLTGTSAPTTSTVGRVGQIYLSTTGNTTYQCVAIDSVTPSYTWVRLIRPTDYATSSAGGVVKISGRGLKMSNGYLSVDRANNGEILAKTNEVNPITPAYVDYAVKVGVTTNTIALTDSEKTSAQSWLGITPRGIARLS